MFGTHGIVQRREARPMPAVHPQRDAPPVGLLGQTPGQKRQREFDTGAFDAGLATLWACGLCAYGVLAWLLFLAFNQVLHGG